MWKAFYRLLEKLRDKFPALPICICGDSLYACERFFRECREADCHYLLRFKEGRIPGIYGEYQKLRKLEGNYQEEKYLIPGKGKVYSSELRLPPAALTHSGRMGYTV